MNNYYCVLPYYSIETDFNNPSNNIFCCRLEQNTDIENVRSSIKNQEKAKECSTCWNLEKNNLSSERILHNRTLDYLMDIDIKNLESQSITKGFDPKIIKLTTSNLCNGQCITCGPQLSSSWARLNNLTSQYKSLDPFTLDIDWASIVSLSFVGGEPLLERKNFLLLQKLIELGNTNVFISIVTNGSIELSDSQINILKKFNNLNICLSIDGIEKRFEYMRFPLSWDQLLKNLEIFRPLAKHLSVSSMISNLNIFYYTEMVDFFKEFNLDYICKQVTNPSIFSPGNLSDKAKEYIRMHNKKYIDQVDAFLSMGDYSEFDNFVKEVARQDALKNISINDYMPQVADLITST